jgi:ubiquinone/menaquinone biosynthesis C-methylase UbiE
MDQDKPSEPMSASGAAFDHVAAHYDADATSVELSRWLRARVWERLAVLFKSGESVLEIGCGTGEDAIWLAKRGVHVTASDASHSMLAETRRKAQQAGVERLIELCQLDLANADAWDLPDAAYDGVTSNYGPLNCIGDWSALGSTLARIVRPGGRIGLAVMGPWCAWEVGWHALHGDLRTAARRWRSSTLANIGGVTFPVYYPTPARLRRDFGSSFRQRWLWGLGVFVPPSDLYAAVGKHRRFARTLTVLERLLAPHWPFKYMGDHYWLELERIKRHQ